MAPPDHTINRNLFVTAVKGRVAVPARWEVVDMSGPVGVFTRCSFADRPLPDENCRVDPPIVRTVVVEVFRPVGAFTLRATFGNEVATLRFITREP